MTVSTIGSNSAESQNAAGATQLGNTQGSAQNASQAQQPPKETSVRPQPGATASSSNSRFIA